MPQLFASDGKGVPSKRVLEYKLAYSKKIPANSFAYPDKTSISINTIFQVWTKINANKIRNKNQHTCNSFSFIHCRTEAHRPTMK